jgi:hypothetical protein
MVGRPIFGCATAPSGGIHTRFALMPRSEPSPRDEAALPLGHAAIVSGHTLFPTRVFDPNERDRVLISGHSNSKIGKSITKGPWAGFPIFTLTLEERATCPRTCAQWDTCYGNAMPFAVRLRYSPALVAALDRELRAHAVANPKGFAVRLHILGDFPDLEYVHRWAAWIAAIPQLHVWGYTAHGRDTNIGVTIAEMNTANPTRWSVRTSVAPETYPAPMQASVTWVKPSAVPASDEILCPAETGKTATCGTCALCWSPTVADKRIVFLGHGMRKRTGPGKPNVAPIQPVAAKSLAAAPVSDPITVGNATFLAKLLIERSRLTQALEAVGALIGIYEKLVPANDTGATEIARPVTTDQGFIANTRAPGAGACAALSLAPASAAISASPVGGPKRRSVISTEGLAVLRANAAKARAAKAARIKDDWGVLRPAASTPTPVAPPVEPPPAPPPRPVQPQISRAEAIQRVSASIAAKGTAVSTKRDVHGVLEAIAMGFDHVAAWGAQRGISFNSWDDLPAINARRDRLQLSPFKREFPMKGRRG